MRDDNVRRVREALAEPWLVASRLGLAKGARRRGASVVVNCPAHADRTPSCSLTMGPDGTLRARCFACGWSGDVFGLIAVLNGLDVRLDFRRVLELSADVAGITIDDRPRRDERAVPRDRLAEIAARVDAASDSWLRGLEVRPDAELEAATPEELVEAVRELVELDSEVREEFDRLDAELDRLADDYDRSHRNTWRSRPVQGAA